MIDPGGIPQIPGDVDALETYARSLHASGMLLALAGADIDSAWQALSAFYRAPEAEQLFAATGPVRVTADSVGADIGVVGDAVTAYSARLRDVKARLASLQAQAQSFVNSVSGDDSWRKDGDKVNHNNELLQAVNAAVADWMAAQRDCANAIDAVFGGTHYRQDDGKGATSPDEYGYSKDQLNSAAASDKGLPWGKPDTRDKPWYEDAWDGVVSFGKGFVVDGLWGTVKGLGNLVGTGGWDKMKNSWIGLEKLGLALTVPGLTELNSVTALPGLKKNELNDTLLNTGKALISWDEWTKDPSRAAGSTVFNVVTVVFSDGAGAGADAAGDAGKVASAAGKAGDAADAASVASKVSDVVSKGVKGLDTLQHVVTGMPKVGDIYDLLKTKFGDVKIPEVEVPKPEVPTGLSDGAKAPVMSHVGSTLTHDGADLGHGAGTGLHDAPVIGGGGGGDHIPTQPHEPPTPHEPPPPDHAPTDHAPTDHAPTDHAPTDHAPTDHAPTDHAPTDHAPTDHAPTDHAPTDHAPTDHAPTDHAPTDTATHMAHAEATVSAGAVNLEHAPDAAAYAYGRSNWDATVDTLPPDVQHAFHEYSLSPHHPDYTGVSYVEINAVMREHPMDAAITARVETDIAAIDHAMTLHPVPEDLMVLRAVDLDYLPVASPLDLIGEDLKQPAYLSTSIGGPAPAFETKSAFMHLRVPAGTPAMWIEKLSAYHTERELLIAHGSTIHINDVIWDGAAGKWQLYGEILPWHGSGAK